MVDLFINSTSTMFFSIRHLMERYSCFNHLYLLMLIILHMFPGFIRLPMVSNKFLVLSIENLVSFLYNLNFKVSNPSPHYFSTPSTTPSSTSLFMWTILLSQPITTLSFQSLFQVFLTNFQSRILGLSTIFLGLKCFLLNGFVSQHKYIRDLLWQHNMTEPKEMTTPLSTLTP